MVPLPNAGALGWQDVINRVEGLEQMGRLTGVMDDRGKVPPSFPLSPNARACLQCVLI